MYKSDIAPNSSLRGVLAAASLAACFSFGLTACDRADPESAKSSADASSDDAVYQTYGVHNSPDISPCTRADCVYERAEGVPPDPEYPQYWVADWNMYRVFQNYADNPPPYRGKPPPALKQGQDYETSTGTTYYDSIWSGESGEGAMMEFYQDRCLPIFPISNKFTCAFISLGDRAFFVTYERDRPAGMPPVCLFSKFNHPPRRDFIKHLPYSKSDSEQIGKGGQGYSFWVKASDGTIVQEGVKPDRTAEGDIMFGYGFEMKNGKIEPQSFYFSGYPVAPANAPIVSQNYTDFRAVKPDPAQTWDLVNTLDPDELPKCQLFNPPRGSKMMLGAEKSAPTWADIGRWKK